MYFEAKLWLSLLCCADRAVSCSQLFRCPRFSFSSAGFKCSVQPWLLVAFFLSLSLALILSCLTLTTRQSAAVVFLGSRSWTHRFPEYRSLIDPSTVGGSSPIATSQQCLRGCLELLHQQGVHGSLARRSPVTKSCACSSDMGALVKPSEVCSIMPLQLPYKIVVSSLA